MKPVKYKDFAKDLQDKGFYPKSNNHGSHQTYTNGAITVSVPMSREIAPGTIRNIQKVINQGNSNKR